MQIVSLAVPKTVRVLSEKGSSMSFLKVFMFVLASVFATSCSVQQASANPKYAGIVIDAKTGKVLYSDDPDGLRYPASLTKMMTLYLTFEALSAGRISLDSKVPVSANASKEPPSKLGVRAGGTVTVEQAIKALVTRSANDMATALGEFIGGSEDRFARMMTNKARALGMTRTTYRNAHGLPNTAQMTTARDQARLGIALRQHYPQYYHYFSTRSFQFGKQTIGNHNRLLGNVAGVDGIKTGYIRAAGFNLVTSVQIDGRSIVGVVIGGTSGASRDAQMRKLVATYLPKASRGANSNLIANTPSADVGNTAVASASAASAASRMDLPNAGPLPQARYENEVASAFAPTSSRAAVQAMEAATRPQAPLPAPMVPPAAIAQSRQAAAVDIDEVTTSSTRQASGWVIQIGASPDKNSAMALLQNAQDKGGNVLNSATPFTVAFSKDGAQVYRARFGGFTDQNKAVNACNALKKKGISCWASLQ
jgi:D-alanyl-D-alanine carboxypeptidase